MTAIFSLGVGILFACGCYLLLKHDFIKIIGGMILISNAANLFIITAGLTRGQEPIYPLEAGRQVSDPLVQAMTLTAIVISFGVTALMISLVYRVYHIHRSVDIERISDIEERAVLVEEATPVEAGIGVMEDREEPDAVLAAPEPVL